MFKTDSTLLIQIQLALIGIVVVVGLFYLWRSIIRLEERVNKSVCKCKNSKLSNNETPFLNNEFKNTEELLHDVFNNDEIKNAEELMKQVFGNEMELNQPTMMMFSMENLNKMPETRSSVIVEEINDSNDKHEDNVEDHISNNENSESETNDDTNSTDVNPMSKSKLSQMKLEKLRALCKVRNLPTDGLKPQLIERLLGLTRE